MPSAAVGSYAALRMRPALYGYTSARLGTIEFAEDFRVSDVHSAGPMWASAPTASREVFPKAKTQAKPAF